MPVNEFTFSRAIRVKTIFLHHDGTKLEAVTSNQAQLIVPLQAQSAQTQGGRALGLIHLHTHTFISRVSFPGSANPRQYVQSISFWCTQPKNLPVPLWFCSALVDISFLNIMF